MRRLLVALPLLLGCAKVLGFDEIERVDDAVGGASGTNASWDCDDGWV